MDAQEKTDKSETELREVGVRPICEALAAEGQPRCPAEL